jgi:sec-independent protein translocase protein TatA
MFGFGMQELLVILAIVLLIFGPKRLKNIGADLGNAIKGFRSAVADEDKPADASAPGRGESNQRRCGNCRQQCWRQRRRNRKTKPRLGVPMTGTTFFQQTNRSIA